MYEIIISSVEQINNIKNYKIIEINELILNNNEFINTLLIIK